MRSKGAAKGTRAGYTDTAAPIGDLDYTILVSKEAIARITRYLKELGRRSESLEEGSPEYEHIVDRVAEIMPHLMDLQKLTDHIETRRTRPSRPKGK